MQNFPNIPKTLKPTSSRLYWNPDFTGTQTLLEPRLYWNAVSTMISPLRIFRSASSTNAFTSSGVIAS